MKAIISVQMLTAFIIIQIILINSEKSIGQQNECWEFTATVKTYYTSARDYETSESDYSYGPYKSAEQCQMMAAKMRGTENFQSWIHLKRETTPSDCRSCSNSNNESSENKSSSVNRDETLENDYLSKISNPDLMNWYKDIINPINASNIASLLGVYAESVPLQLLGTALGAISISKAYVSLFEKASESALKNAMDLINVPWESRQDFLSSAGTYVMSQKLPDSYHSKEDMYIAQNAFLLSALITSDHETDASVITKSALFGLAGLIAAETGNDNAAKTLISSAMITLMNIPDSQERTYMTDMMERTNTGYSLNMEKLNDPDIFNKMILQQNLKNNISGDYKCIDCPQGYGTSRIENGNLKVTQNGNNISIYWSSVVYHQGVSSMGVEISAHQTNGSLSGSGVLIENEAKLSGKSQSNSSQLTSYNHQTGQTRTTQPNSNEFPFSGTLKIITNNNIQIQFDPMSANQPSETNTFKKIQ